MHPTELIIQFPTAQQFRVTFGEAHSETIAFNNPVSAKDHQDIAWYIETYAAHSLADPDDHEAQRIEARLAAIGKALFEKARRMTHKARAFWHLKKPTRPNIRSPRKCSAKTCTVPKSAW